MSLKADEVALAIMALQQGHTDRGAEAQILDLLTRIDDATLDSVVLSLDLTALFSDVDNRWLGPDNLTALLHLLSRKRIAALSVDARGAIVDALQVGRTDRLDERAIADMLCATSGTALTDLKNVIDAGADHRDLQHLVYNDIDDDEIRAELLAHFKTHDAACGSLKVLSDIDDTFYANWKDDRFPKETVYPGVRQLYDELGGDLAFVTARPRDRPGVVEHATHEMLRSHGLEDVTVLAGCVSKLLTNASIADKKLQNFVEYAQLYPEYGYVFIGDSGQGDAMFGREMRVREPDRVKAVLIHDVVATDRATRREWRNDGVLLFDTYVGAAVEARAIGLLTDDAVQRVVDAATNELDAIKFDGADQHYARRRELDRDVARADG